MKVSLLIPVYGVEQFIEKCAISLFEQTYRNIEYIFVDDCTPDCSIEVLNGVIGKYPERRDDIKILRHSKNLGLAQARNTALDAATGDFILNVDSDDYLELKAIERLCEVAYNEKADVVVFGSYTVYLKNKIAKPNAYNYTTKEAYIKSLLEKKSSSCVWGKFVSHNLYVKTKIRAIPGLNQGEDYAVIPRLLYYADHIVMIKDCLYNYVQYNNEAYTKSFHKKHISDLMLADKTLSEFFLSIPERDLYENTIAVAKLRTKTYMLKIANTISDIKEIAEIYLDISNKYFKELSLADRIILRLLHFKCYRLILFFISTGFLIKRNLRRL